MKTKFKVIFISLALILVIRELGLVSFNCYKHKNIRSVMGVKSNVEDGRPNLHDIEISITPSFLDYIPLYKSRKFQGEIFVKDRTDGSSLLNVEYSFDLTVLGFCSGYEFREIIRVDILEEIYDT